MATTNTTSPIVVAALPEVLTVDDVAIDAPIKTVQVILVPATPDAELFEGAREAWNIFLVEGHKTRFIGNVHHVRTSPWTGEFVGQYVDHEQADLFVSDSVRTRHGAANSAVRWYFSQIAFYTRQRAAQERREALASTPGECRIEGCDSGEDTAHVIIDGRVWDACKTCRHDYDLDVVTAA